MTVILILLAAVMFGFVGWLVSQSVNVQPWVATSSTATAAAAMRSTGIQAQPDAKIALLVLMAVLSSLFGLFISAYVLRMELADWRPVPEPMLLWLNTGLLFLGSMAMHRAFTCSRRDDRASTLGAMIFAGICLCLFIVGQFLAWQQLSGLGYFAFSNPANAFFYLITGLHVVHIVGGVIAWGATLRRLLSAENTADVQLSIQLCGIYVHFLLIVWFVLFALLLST